MCIFRKFLDIFKGNMTKSTGISVIICGQCLCTTRKHDVPLQCSFVQIKQDFWRGAQFQNFSRADKKIKLHSWLGQGVAGLCEVVGGGGTNCMLTKSVFLCDIISRCRDFYFASIISWKLFLFWSQNSGLIVKPFLSVFKWKLTIAIVVQNASLNGKVQSWYLFWCLYC